jgi:hypothetical protein
VASTLPLDHRGRHIQKIRRISGKSYKRQQEEKGGDEDGFIIIIII